MNIKTHKITKKNKLLFIPLFDNEHTFKGDHSTWNVAYNMHEIQINLLKKTHTHRRARTYLIIIMRTQQIGKT
jgi:hypothetical protein